MTVSEQIIQVLDALGEKFGIMIDWTGENVIPYVEHLCEKLIAWEIWSSVTWIAVMVVLTIASIIATKILYPTFKNGCEENAKSYCDCGWQVASGVAVIGLIGLYVATFVVIANQTFNIIKCITFPEMFIFEYIQSVINSGS